MSLNRRNLMVIGVAGAGALAAANILPGFVPARRFDFTPVSSPAGFRRIARGDGLSAGQLLTGFEASTTRRLTPLETCVLTFGDKPNGPGHLTIAVFSDFFCPYCRVLDAEVRALAARDDRVQIVPHEVPLLGRASDLAARAVIAAAAQGAYDAFHARLIRTTFVPTPAYLRDIAKAQGLDVARFQQDMQSPETTQQLQGSAAAFRAFGFAGTPALAVGRTLVNGVISTSNLKALIALEIEEDVPEACR